MSENIRTLPEVAETIRAEAAAITAEVLCSNDGLRVEEIYANPMTQEFTRHTVVQGSTPVDSDLHVWRSVTSKFSYGVGERIPAFRVGGIVSRAYLDNDPHCFYRNWRSADLLPQHIANVVLPIADLSTEGEERRREEVAICVQDGQVRILRSEWVTNPQLRFDQLQNSYVTDIRNHWRGPQGYGPHRALSPDQRQVMERAIERRTTLETAASTYLRDHPSLYKKSWAESADVLMSDVEANAFVERLTAYGKTIISLA